MAITIEKEPAPPLLTKNEIAWKVSTDDSTVEKIIAHLNIEGTPYSSAWTLAAKKEAVPDPDDSHSCWFFFDDVLDKIMEYEDPSTSSDVVDSSVCRRVQVEFYEYKSSDEVLHADLYSDTHQIIEVDDFIEEADYLIKIDYTNSSITEANRVRIGSGINTTPNPDELSTALAISDAWTLESDTGYQLEKQSNIGLNAGYDDVVVPAKTGVKLYEWTKPTSVTSTVRYVLKGGLDPSLFAEMTKDSDYWVDENLDNVVDEDGNLVTA